MSETLLVVIVSVFAGAVFVLARSGLEALHRRLDRLSRIEGKLDALLKHSSIRFDPLDGFPAEALAALKQGRKIEAIKHYRQATGAGLAEAKDAVEEAQRRGAS